MPRRPAAETRETIREAAAPLFRERGFARTSVRDIAADAEVDPALVIRHFGSKEELFLATMHVDIDPIRDVPLDELGRRFLADLLDGDRDTRSVFLALLRGSNEPAIGERLRLVHEAAFVAPLRERMTGADVDVRARLAAALVGGLLYSLWVVGDEALDADHPSIVEHYGALLQQLITP